MKVHDNSNAQKSVTVELHGMQSLHQVLDNFCNL